MKQTFAVPAPNAPAREPGRSPPMPDPPIPVPPMPVRFQIRPVIWGNHRRYEVIDTRTDTTLVVRATRVGADDDVLVLNMGGRGGPQVSHVPVPGPPVTRAEDTLSGS